MSNIDKSILKRSRDLVNEADSILIAAGAGLSIPASINYYDKQKFAELFPALVKKGYQIQYELITHHAVNNKIGWTHAVMWGYLAIHVNYVYYQIQNDPIYQQLYSLVKDQDYFVMTTNVDGLFVQNNFSENRIYTPQGSFSRIQCINRCSEETWDAKPIIDKILPHIDPITQEVNDLSCIPSCPKCGGDMFMNVRGGNWFIDQPYTLQKANLNKWIDNTIDKKIVVLDIGTGFNTPSVVRWPVENLIEQHPNGSLIRVNLNHSEVPKEIAHKSISIKGDIAEFMSGIFNLYLK